MPNLLTTNRNTKTGQFTASAVACGRRICTSPHHTGQRWLPIIYFNVSEWHDVQRTKPKRIAAHCQTCQRIANRLRNGHEPLQPSKTGYRQRTPAERLRYQKYRKAKYDQRSAQKRAEAREYARDYAEQRRRAEGVKPRHFRNRHKRPRHLSPQAGEPHLPAAPLIKFLEEMVHRHGLSAVARGSSLGHYNLKALLDGEIKEVTLGEADRVLTGLGFPHELAIIYPEEN
jgi:hypothetical protein